MKKYLTPIAIAVLLASAWLIWKGTSKEETPPLVIAVDKAEAARLIRLARQKKDGIIPVSHRGELAAKEQEKINTLRASPSSHTSLIALDLSRTPTEAQLVKAGQLLDPLSPTGPADPARIVDPAAKAWQEKDNIMFGNAVQAWNDGNIETAVSLFRAHVESHPQSPWVAESRLHLATAADRKHYFPETYQQVEAILKGAAKGSDVYQKAFLLKAEAMVKQGKYDDAVASYLEAMRSETSDQRKKRASGWLIALSQFKKSKT